VTEAIETTAGRRIRVRYAPEPTLELSREDIEVIEGREMFRAIPGAGEVSDRDASAKAVVPRAARYPSRLGSEAEVATAAPWVRQSAQDLENL
jgi:hypothetical protein